MLGILVCPECESRTNIDLRREFYNVRCQRCDFMMNRDDHLRKEEDGKAKEKGRDAGI